MEIKVKNVTKDIKGRTVLKEVSATFSSGKIIGLKGVNGSGKTMLMRALSGLILPTSGSIHYGEKQLGKDMTFPESLGMILENPAFLDSYSGLENLAMLASLQQKIDRNTAKVYMQKVGLDPEDAKKYKKYSLGMKQRLGIAAAVMEAPDVVLLDEPTNALDSGGIEIFLRIAQEERTRGALVVIACHDFEILKQLCDEIYYMEEGRITGHVAVENGELLPLEGEKT